MSSHKTTNINYAKPNELVELYHAYTDATEMPLSSQAQGDPNLHLVNLDTICEIFYPLQRKIFSIQQICDVHIIVTKKIYSNKYPSKLLSERPSL